MYSDKLPFCSLEVLGIYASLLGMQIGLAVNAVLVENELSKGLEGLAFIVYSNAVGALVLAPFALFLEKRKRPATMSLSLFVQFFLLSAGGVCAVQALMLMGLKDTSPAFVSAMPNLAPAIIFVMAWALGLVLAILTLLESRKVIDPGIDGRTCEWTTGPFLMVPSALSWTASILSPLAWHSLSLFTLHKLNQEPVEPVDTGYYGSGSRMEKVDITRTGSRSKIVGTLVCVSGATAMCFLRGPALSQLWLSKAHSISDPSTLYPVENILAILVQAGDENSGKQIRGCIYLVSAVTILSSTVILQAETVKKYQAPLSQASITAILGSIQTAVLITFLDRGIKPTSWVIDRSGILAIVYAGIICNGITLALQLWCIQKRGPVFVTIFSPVGTVCSAILSSLFLGDKLHLGTVIGILLIFAGLYLVLWGKSKDSVAHIKISSEKEEDLHTAEEQHHPFSSQVLDAKKSLLLPISK